MSIQAETIPHRVRRLLALASIMSWLGAESRAEAQTGAAPEEAQPVPPNAAPSTANPEPEGETVAPLAGYSEKNFFLRDSNDWFVLIPKGRLNVDDYSFLSRPGQPPGGIVNGPLDTRPKDTLFLRRARWGIAGTIAKHIDFRIEAEFASVPSLGQYASLTDCSVVVNYTPFVQVEVGQFYTPFTLENPTSENYTDFMEKAAVTRFAVPTSRETGVMLQGASRQQVVRYWGGVFDGEGQNVRNLDYGGAVIGRAAFAPFALIPRHDAWVEDVWIGGSGWVQKTQNLGGQGGASTTGATLGDLSPVTTQSGVSVFNSNYANGVDSANNAIRAHLAPNGDVSKYALELNAPIFDRVGVRAEYSDQSIEVTDYGDTSAGRAPGASGVFRGWGAYGEVYVWLGELVNVDRPGLYQPPHWGGYQSPSPPKMGVMLAAKYEHVGFDVRMQGTTKADTAAGSYSLDVFELGGSLWLTRHSRFMANYVFNYIGAADNAPRNEQSNLFFRKADHELAFRLAVSL